MALFVKRSSSRRTQRIRSPDDMDSINQLINPTTSCAIEPERSTPIPCLRGDNADPAKSCGAICGDLISR
jgi:hypothetical protein